MRIRPLFPRCSLSAGGLLWGIGVALTPFAGMAQTTLPANPIPRIDVNLSQQDSLYRLGPGDNVQIDVFNVPEFSGPQRVLIDGTVTLPLIGSIIVKGLTLKQASDELAIRLSNQLQRPIVSIRVLDPRPLRIAVVGQVKRPGAYIVTADPSSSGGGGSNAQSRTVTSVGLPTVSQLLQTADGVTPQADIRRIQVSRTQSRGTDQVFTIDLWDLLQSGDLQKDLVLLDGDTVFVPTAPSIDLREATELASANISPATITVNVVGQVTKPGAITLAPNAPMNQAILAAGGFSSSADNSSVELIRLNPNGSVSARQVPVNFAAGLNDQLNPALQNTDVIIVRKSAIADASETLGQFLDPFLRLRAVINLFN